MFKRSLFLFVFILSLSGCTKADRCQSFSDRALNSYKAGDYVEADRFYRKAIDCSPEDAALWNALGEVNYKSGRIEVADSAFEKATEIDAGFFKPWYNYALMAFDNEDYVKSLEYVEKALVLAGDNDEVKNLHDKLREKLGMVTELDP